MRPRRTAGAPRADSLHSSHDRVARCPGAPQDPRHRQRDLRRARRGGRGALPRRARRRGDGRRARAGALAAGALAHVRPRAPPRRRPRSASTPRCRAFTAAGIPAQGALGDADPLQALDDAIRTFEPDEVVISTHPPQRSNWLERQVVSKARGRYDLPITHVVVDLELESSAPPDAAPRPRRRARWAGARAAPARLPRQRLRRRPRHPRVGLPRRRRGPARRGLGHRPAARSPPGATTWSSSPSTSPRPWPATTSEDADGDGRRFLLPAELLNRHGPPVVEGDWSE